MNMEKLIKETISRIGKEFVQVFRLGAISDINKGRGERFRDVVVDELTRLAPGEHFSHWSIQDYHFAEGFPAPFSEYKDMPYHAWFIYEGRHYDAETPEGVEEWQELPFYQNWEANETRYRKERVS